MNADLFPLYIFFLSCFIGYFVVWGVTPSLHTPLISLTNAISGVILLGALLVAGSVESNDSTIQTIGFIAVVLATINIVGGFVVTQRMLAMFQKKKGGK